MKNPIWVNLVQMKNGDWFPCWYEQYLGADKFQVAIASRKRLQKAMQLANPDWRDSRKFRTVKVYV